MAKPIARLDLRELNGRSLAEVYGRSTSHHRCAEAFYKPYLEKSL